MSGTASTIAGISALWVGVSRAEHAGHEGGASGPRPDPADPADSDPELDAVQAQLHLLEDPTGDRVPGDPRHPRPAVRRAAHRPVGVRPAAQDREDPHGYPRRNQPPPGIRLRRRRRHRLPHRGHRNRLQILDDYGGWDLPPEVVDHLALLITANDEARPRRAGRVCDGVRARSGPQPRRQSQLTAAARSQIR